MMNYIFTLAYRDIFIFLALLLLLLGWYRLFKWRAPVCQLALTNQFLERGLAQRNYLGRLILVGLRFASLLLLVLAMGRPQLVDPHSRIRAKGIDLVLALDVSYSMQSFDDLDHPKSRIEIAKEEAQKFVAQRSNDLIGIVIFARQAFSRCPLILDQAILKNLIDNLQIGQIEPSATMLTIGLMTAINRLKHSNSSSKAIILLTDGQPSLGDLDPKVAIEIAKKLNIKVYTVGIGSVAGGYFEHPLVGVMKMPGDSYNPKLLQQLAQETGGKFFQAHNQAEMQAAYDQINQLEKTERVAPVYAKKTELFGWCLLGALGLLLVELVLSYSVWFGL